MCSDRSDMEGDLLVLMSVYGGSKFVLGFSMLEHFLALLIQVYSHLEWSWQSLSQSV